MGRWLVSLLLTSICARSCPRFLKICSQGAKNVRLNVFWFLWTCFDLFYLRHTSLCSVTSSRVLSFNLIFSAQLDVFIAKLLSSLLAHPTPEHTASSLLWHSFFFRWTIRIMFNINLLENLKVYISSRPPLVVFMISVSAMAIAFLTLGYFFKIKEIKSPEMTEVWYKHWFVKHPQR